MEKDAYYFPHFSNARHDRKLKRLIKELGVEGYGIYFMALEVLRDQDGFRYPIEDIDLLADEFGTSEQKMRTVISNYKLFQVDEEENFFSAKFNDYMKPYIEGKQRSKISGIKGNLIKYKYLTKETANKMTDEEIIAFDNLRKQGKVNDNKLISGGESRGDSEGGRKESKVKESKVKESKEDIASLMQHYQNNISGNVPQIVVQSIIDWMNTFSIDMMKEAINITAKKQAQYNYMEAILNSWETKGYKTLADVSKEQGKIDDSTKEKNLEEARRKVQETLNGN